MHLSAAGDQQCAWCRAFSDLTVSRLPCVGVLGLTPRVLHALLGLLQPSMQVLARSTQRLGTNALSFALVVPHVVVCTCRPANSRPPLDILAGWRYDAGNHGRLSRGGNLRPSRSPHMPRGFSVPAAGNSAQLG